MTDIDNIDSPQRNDACLPAITPPKPRNLVESMVGKFEESSLGDRSAVIDHVAGIIYAGSSNVPIKVKGALHHLFANRGIESWNDLLLFTKKNDLTIPCLYL